MRKYLLHVFIIDLSYLVKDKAMATIPKKTIGKIKIMKKSTLLLFLFVFVLAGCAVHGKSTSVTITSPKVEIDNEVFIDRPFSDVWDELVKELAKSFYVINNIEKTSRIINISFSTDTPEEYIDCGTTTRTYEKGEEHTKYTYKVVESSSYKLASKAGQHGQFPVMANINRKTSLEGRANVYVAPEDNGTRVTVNCRYIFSVNVSGNYITYDVFGNPIPFQSGEYSQTSESIAFNTNQEKTVNWGTAEQPADVNCYSTGKLEQDILSFIK